VICFGRHDQDDLADILLQGMKRWGFKGQGASHGVSLTHRSMGSAGGSQGSGSRVHPGKKMAGNMGNYHHTVQNLKVMLVDAVNGLVVVSGKDSRIA
jgi:large subunit ribosomal protein L3